MEERRRLVVFFCFIAAHTRCLVEKNSQCRIYFNNVCVSLAQVPSTIVMHYHVSCVWQGGRPPWEKVSSPNLFVWNGIPRPASHTTKNQLAFPALRCHS